MARFVSKTYRVWSNMLSRCRNPNSPNWDRYGGRGIKVCERWHAFGAFLKDMGEAPSGLSLDRIDNDGNYEPSNCRWTTRAEQAKNQANNVWITVCGETRLLGQWALALGCSHKTLRYRLDNGWSDHEAICTPIRQQKLGT